MTGKGPVAGAALALVLGAATALFAFADEPAAGSASAGAAIGSPGGAAFVPGSAAPISGGAAFVPDVAPPAQTGPAGLQGREGRPAAAQDTGNSPYDGRFALARIRFGQDLGSFGYGRRAAAWAHDYPAAERNLMAVIREVSFLRPSRDSGNIFDLDDPELMRFPVAYLVEPGFWQPSGEDVENLREYLLKGGFLIVDDFRGRDWSNFEFQMRRVLPEHDMVELDESSAIFQQFLPMETLDFPHPYSFGANPTYLGIYEENDPTRRIMVIVNYDQDIGEYWEYLAQGRFALDPTNDAMKLGLNYLFYAMTH